MEFDGCLIDSGGKYTPVTLPRMEAEKRMTTVVKYTKVSPAREAWPTWRRWGGYPTMERALKELQAAGNLNPDFEWKVQKP